MILGNNNKISKLIKFDENLYKDIQKYRDDNFFSSFTGAVRDLIRKGLESQEPKK